MVACISSVLGLLAVLVLVLMLALTARGVSETLADKLKVSDLDQGPIS